MQLGIGTLACHTHGTQTLSAGFGLIICFGADRRPHIGRQHTAAAGNRCHHGMSVTNNICLFSVGRNIDSTCDNNDGIRFLRQSLGPCHHQVEIFLGHFIGFRCIDTTCRTGSQGKCLDFGNIAADDIGTNFFQNPNGCIGAQSGSTCAYGIQQNRMPQFMGFLTCRQHGRDSACIERADIEDKTAADGGHLGSFFRFIGHDGATTRSQQNIGTIVDRDIVGDAVDEGIAFVQLCAKIKLHGVSPFNSPWMNFCPPLLFGHKKTGYAKTYPGSASVPIQKQCSASFAGMIRIRFEGSRLAYSPLSLCSRLPRASF